MRLAAIFFLQGKRGADQSKMSKGLREIAQRIPRCGINFLRKQTKIAAVRKEVIKEIMGLDQSAPSQRQIFDCPETADAKGALRRLALIPIEQTVAGAQLLADPAISQLH